MKKFAFLTILALFATLAGFSQSRETRNVGNFTKINFRVPGTLYLKQGSSQKVEIEANADLLKQIETNVDGSKLVIEKDDKWDDWDDDDEIKVYITITALEGLSVSGSGSVIGETKFTADNLDLNVSGSGSMKIEAEAKGEVDSKVSGSGHMDVKGTCNSLNGDVSGSGKITLSMTIKGQADFGVSGSGKIEAGGTADNVKTAISGSGKLLAADLQANRCEVRISGSGDVEINVSNELDASISGSGTVSYKGNPKKINSHASGSGTVRKM